jgi:hypothetical protein
LGELQILKKLSLVEFQIPLFGGFKIPTNGIESEIPRIPKSPLGG